MGRNLLLASVCVIALAGADHSWAQTASDPTAGASQLEEIVVTAQRRDERLQDVPISVTALSEQRLESGGVTSTEDLTIATPGLVFGRSNSFSQPTIRGVGSRNGSQGDESSVAIYIDGVYRPEQFSNLFELDGVQQIEVLKGPQGTLFGRNAAGGAINITTKMPSEEFEGSASVTVGEFNYRKASVYLSGPLSEQVSANIAVTGLEDDGFIRNIFLNTDSGARSLTAVRGKLAWDINDTTRLWLGGNYAIGDDNTNQSGQPLNGNSRGRQINPDVLYATAPWTTSTQFPVVSKNRSSGFDLHLEKQFSGADLRVIAAHSKSRQYNLTDADNTPTTFSSNDTTFRADTTSLEAVLASTGDRRLHWTVGVNYFENTAELDPFLSGAVRFSGAQETKAVSVFGEAVWEVVDNLFLTAGARYSNEEREARYRQATPTVVNADGSDSWSDVSPRLVVRYQYADNSNVYASYSRGFKSGTFNASSALGASTPADPEYIDAFEVGVKTDLGDRVRLNAAAFYYQYQDLQVTVPMFVNGATVFALSNAAQSVSYGVEGNAEIAVTDALNLRVGVSLLEATYDEFPAAVVVEPNPAFITRGAPAGNLQVARDVSGNYLSRSPTWTVSLGGDYTQELFGGELMLTADVYSSAEWYSDPLNRLRQPSYTQLNASVRWTTPAENLSFVLTGENLTDAEVYSNLFTSAVGDFVSYQRPSFVSLKAEYRF